MAEQNSNSYPMISEKAWWTLRDKFVSSIPSTMTPSYVMNILSMSSEHSAVSNVITPFKKLKLIDEEGKPTDLANKWRLDSQYKEACNSMIADTYPGELLDIFPNNEINKKQAIDWFLSKGNGRGAAQKMAAVFALLKKGEIEDIKSTNTAKLSKTQKSKVGKKVGITIDKPIDDSVPTMDSSLKSQPNLHIDLQIHISPDSTPEQIETIFSSMSKHLYGNID